MTKAGSKTSGEKGQNIFSVNIELLLQCQVRKAQTLATWFRSAISSFNSFRSSWVTARKSSLLCARLDTKGTFSLAWVDRNSI